MKRLRNQDGAAMVLMLGVASALALLAITLVMVTSNTQGATANNRTQVQAFNFAEAGLDSAAAAIGSAVWPATAGSSFADSADVYAAYEASIPSEERPEVTILTYDNLSPIDTAIEWDSNGDKVMWVDAQVTVNGESSRVRTQVKQATSNAAQSFPNAAIYTDGDIIFSGSSNVFGRNADGTPFVDGATGLPLSAVYAGGDLSRGWHSTFSTVDIKLNGADTWRGNTTPHDDNVAPLSSVMPQSTIDSLTTQAKQGESLGAVAPAAVNSGTVLHNNSAEFVYPQWSANYATPVVVHGDLNIRTQGTYNFGSLWVDGNLTLSGNTTTRTTALYVGGNLTIGGPSARHLFGSTYVVGNVNFGGEPPVTCTSLRVGGNLLVSGPSEDMYFGPTWVGGKLEWLGSASCHSDPLYVAGLFKTEGGGFNHVMGNTYAGGGVWIMGDNAQLNCPLMVTPGQIHTQGSARIGTMAQPTLLLGLDNGDGVSKNLEHTSNGVFTGLLVNMDGGVTLPGGNGDLSDVIGGIMCIGDVISGGNTGVIYVPDAMPNLPTTTNMTITAAVPGTWQEVKPLP